MRDDIQKLKKVIDRNQETRSKGKTLKEWLYGRQDEIKSAPNRVTTDFWCEKCQRDCVGEGLKVIRTPKGSVWFAYYAGICPQGHRVIRRITDKLGDPFFIHSEKIKREQGLFHDDMLAPSHPRFRQLYPTQYRRLFLEEQGIATKPITR